jgi:hypothetical protein
MWSANCQEFPEYRMTFWIGTGLQKLCQSLLATQDLSHINGSAAYCYVYRDLLCLQDPPVMISWVTSCHKSRSAV